MSYFAKWKGAKAYSGIPYPKLRAVLISGLGAFIAVSILVYCTVDLKVLLFIVPFGASTFLVFAAPTAPFAQPRNVVGGHLISALVGVACYQLFGGTFWVAGLACGVATALMVATKTMHPPAGATAVVPVMTKLGSWLWPFYPTALGACVLVILGLIYNNLFKERTYPDYWC
jgi:CBS-domain-containing membrane protein